MNVLHGLLAVFVISVLSNEEVLSEVICCDHIPLLIPQLVSILLLSELSPKEHISIIYIETIVQHLALS